MEKEKKIREITFIYQKLLFFLILQLLEQEWRFSTIECQISGFHRPLIFAGTPYLFWIKIVHKTNRND